MSEQTKPSKSLSERVQLYFKMKELLEAKYEALLQEVAEVYDPNAKVQVYSGFSFVPPKMELDEKAALTQYLLQEKSAEDLYMTIEERKQINKEAENALVKDALVWHTKQGLEMPKKPRKGYLKLNKKGMQEVE
jgi:hypothetical protein